MLIRQDRFSGERPKLAQHLLAYYEAQIAKNCDLSRGNLKPFRAHTILKNLSDGALKTIYNWKIQEGATNEWISSTSQLHFARSPVSGDAHSRVYYTGLSEPRVLTTSIMSANFDFDTDYYKLGVPAPEDGDQLTITGHTTGTGYRAYLYTYVVVLNGADAEEGINSDIAYVEDYGSGDVTLGNFTAPPANRSIGKIRIYRISTASSGAADFVYVGEFSTVGVDFDTYTFTDDVAEADLGEVLSTSTFSPPPQGLKGIIALKNGSLAGFVGNRVFFSEPYLPHAWPYNYALDATIIGLGVIGSTIIALTDAEAYKLEGPPDAISDTIIDGRYPCVSSAGIVSCEAGVIYPSNTGIVLITYDGAQLYSHDYFDRDTFIHQYAPSSMRAEYYNNRYIVCFDGNIIVLNLIDKNMYRITDPFPVSAIHHSVVDNKLYFAGPGDDDNDNALYEFEGNIDGTYLQYTWRSKMYLLPYETNLSIVKIEVDPTMVGNEAQITANAAAIAAGDMDDGLVNVPLVNEVGAIPNYDPLEKTYSSTFNFYHGGNGTLLHTETITGNKTFRLPGGVLYRRCFYEIVGNLPIVEVKIASSSNELTLES